MEQAGHTTKKAKERTLVMHPVLKQELAASGRNAEDRLDEAVGLALALDLDVIEKGVVTLSALRPSTFIGKGKLEEFAEIIEAHEIKLVVMDTALSPGQQRNLEKAWNCKVIDRTALILEIFADRARTKEGKLQVELAQLTYQKSRLVRSWTHLERQRGGFGFMGGPGETQIEADRRMIGDRIIRIKRMLETVVKTRELHRKTRRDVPYPIIALVGYTNAGKSTLFNRLTGASVVAEDKLFATLDPTLRAIKLPSGMKVILSDTVGFISDLPTELVAAFRATLEEVVEADVLLHVRDISHPDTEHQKKDVVKIIHSLCGDDAELIEVWNKMDLLNVVFNPEAAAQLTTEYVEAEQEAYPIIPREKHKEDGIPVSALTGQGMGGLLTRLDNILSEKFHNVQEFKVPVSDGQAIAWLYANGQVLSADEENGVMYIRALMAEKDTAKFRKLFSAELS